MGTQAKELASLLTAVITEICDDSDDEDFLPFKAMEELYGYNISNEEPRVKKRKVVENSIQLKKMKGLKMRYVTPARFENKEILNIPVHIDDVNEKMCYDTTKPTSICLCPKHCDNVSLSQVPFDINLHDYSLMSESDFTSNFKMKRSTVEIIYKLINTESTGKPCLSPVEYLAALWHLTLGERLSEIENRFSVAKETIPGLERTLCTEINKKRFDFERWPHGRAIEVTQNAFLNICGLSGVLSVIDTVHFSCNGLPYGGIFLNQNYEKTCVYQLACNHRGSFTYSSYFWWPGKWGGSNVIFNDSSITNLRIPEDSYLLATHNYAAFKYTLCPYMTDDHLGKREKQFNEYHDRGMAVLHNAVFALVSRFSVLRVLETSSHWVLRVQFMACVLLHNICLELEDEVDIDPNLEPGSFFPSRLFPNSKYAGRELRNRVCQQLQLESGS